jgi:U3 small nucleolar ribonucleoprotein component
VFGAGIDEEDDGEDEGNSPDQDREDHENDVFAMARENKEMNIEVNDQDSKAADKPKSKTYANEEMLEKINKIEDEMMDDKKWQLKGEVACKDRNFNSLLEEYVDFDTATKLPPQITKETTNNIESMIK